MGLNPRTSNLPPLGSEHQQGLGFCTRLSCGSLAFHVGGLGGVDWVRREMATLETLFLLYPRRSGKKKGKWYNLPFFLKVGHDHSPFFCLSLRAQVISSRETMSYCNQFVIGSGLMLVGSMVGTAVAKVRLESSKSGTISDIFWNTVHVRIMSGMTTVSAVLFATSLFTTAMNNKSMVDEYHGRLLREQNNYLCAADNRVVAAERAARYAAGYDDGGYD